MSDEKLPHNTTANFLIFTAETGTPRIEVRIEGEMVWLTQKLMAELFDVTVPTINEHLKNIFESAELQSDSVIRNFRITATDGKEYETKHYNLDAVIAVGYRVNSKRATHFRIWATQVLREFIIKGFVLDDDRLKQGKKTFGVDYFRELLERVRSIRASERRIYQQITDIFAECSIDYDRDSADSMEFYAMIQNKFHFAITGKTAPEIIHGSADAEVPHMGLTTWKHSPSGRILQSDVTVAKNYLQEDEIRQLERTVTGFFDYIEGLIERNNSFTMKEFAESVDKFLTFNEYKILEGKGHISIELTKKQYWNLMRATYMADWMANAICEQGMKEDAAIKAIRNHVFSYAEEMGYEQYAEYSEDLDRYVATFDMDDEPSTRKLIDRYDEHTMWETLIRWLGERDFFKKYSKEQIKKRRRYNNLFHGAFPLIDVVHHKVHNETFFLFFERAGCNIL